MRVLTIGRGEDCDIILDDPQDLISRRHALLRFYPLGKIEIVPLGRNKTYLNGLEIKNEHARKVTRNDVISFAHVKQLNWKTVPNPYARIYYIIAAVLAVILLFFAIILIYPRLNSGTSSNSDIQTEITTEGGASGGGMSGTPAKSDTAKQEDLVPKKYFPPADESAKGAQKSPKASKNKKPKGNDKKNENIQAY